MPQIILEGKYLLAQNKHTHTHTHIPGLRNLHGVYTWKYTAQESLKYDGKSKSSSKPRCHIERLQTQWLPYYRLIHQSVSSWDCIQAKMQAPLGIISFNAANSLILSRAESVNKESLRYGNIWFTDGPKVEKITDFTISRFRQWDDLTLSLRKYNTCLNWRGTLNILGSTNQDFIT